MLKRRLRLRFINGAALVSDGRLYKLTSADGVVEVTAIDVCIRDPDFRPVWRFCVDRIIDLVCSCGDTRVDLADGDSLIFYRFSMSAMSEFFGYIEDVTGKCFSKKEA